ncbi:MAG: UDP-2,3-diacylglucosamine diphosphatase [Candidatus Kapabacteria bacterium]|nr:UDP-2,3-diacylglucosamine diphosphatase [Candidatus Kapabacteria bacterium]MCS7169428.1 UDP-2,3-diacylglucosamine diphosphatase [Candidatus Kapabacteria bacterium]MDW7997472.1 UDP-2,3-diacylglucosamine diphosphatase [Bacteroidota bacterium]MDW8225012.1 UDP-2,3-diacylglucosamine diphosphatase [Bacteroidota bacterium]
MACICFLGDVHLGCGTGTEQRKRALLFQEFLAALPGYCSHLVILGDLFDYWFDYRTVIPKDFWAIVAALGMLRHHGIAVDYIIGNHDFGHWRFFRDELDIIPCSKDIVRKWHGKRFYISHGDGKMPGDWGYLLLRAILRNGLAQSLYRWLHPDVGIGLARWASRNSRLHAAPLSQRLAQSLESFAQRKLAEGYDVVVLGHSHLPTLKPLGAGWYLNPGGWLVTDPLFARFDGQELELIAVRDFLSAMGKKSSSSAINV